MEVSPIVFAALFMVSTVDAVVVTVGDFLNNQGLVSESNVDEGTTTSTIRPPPRMPPLTLPEVDSRTLSIEEKTFLDPGQNAVQVVGGVIDITHGNDNSEIITSWNLEPNIFVGPIVKLGLRLNVFESDGNPPALALAIDANSLEKFVIAQTTVSRIVDFVLNSAFVTAVNAGGTLKLPSSGALRWDLASN